MRPRSDHSLTQRCHKNDKKGLCFWYDDRYTLGHCCKSRELEVLLLDEFENKNGEGDEPTQEAVQVADEGIGNTVELSLNFVVELTTPRTIKVNGTIG